MGKQLELFPELDLNSKEPIQYDHGSGQFINKFKEVVDSNFSRGKIDTKKSKNQTLEDVAKENYINKY